MKSKDPITAAISDMLDTAKRDDLVVFALVANSNGVSILNAIHTGHLPFKLTPVKGHNGMAVEIDESKLNKDSGEDLSKFIEFAKSFVDGIYQKVNMLAGVYINYTKKTLPNEEEAEGQCFQCGRETSAIATIQKGDGSTIEDYLCLECAGKMGFNPDLLSDSAGGPCGLDDVLESRESIHSEGEKGVHGKSGKGDKTDNASRPSSDPSNN